MHGLYALITWSKSSHLLICCLSVNSLDYHAQSLHLIQFEKGSGTEVALKDRFSTCTHPYNEGDIGADVAVWEAGPHDNHVKVKRSIQGVMSSIFL